MRKNLLLILSLFISLTAGAQAQVNTKKFILSDFREKTLDVILTGNDMTDAIIRSEMQNVWYISQYEFCSRGEFDKRKNSEDYYFLLVTDKTFGKEDEAGIRMLTIFKGTDKAGDDLDNMFKVTSIPFCSAGSADGEEAEVLPVLLEVLQKEVERIMERPFNPTSNVTITPRNKLRKWGNCLVLNQGDLNFETGISMNAIYKDKGIIVNTDEAQDKFELAKAGNALVGYVVAPDRMHKGSVCFTMVFNLESKEICHIRKRIIGENGQPGFTQAELRRIFLHISK